MNIQQAHDLSSSFWLANQRCMEPRVLPNGQPQLPIVPAIVCAALSVEIGFKAITLSTGSQSSGHKLADLYTKLPIEYQNLILAEVGTDETSFQQELLLVSNAFVEWRYIYEQEHTQININFLNRLALAVQNASSRARPSA